MISTGLEIVDIQVPMLDGSHLGGGIKRCTTALLEGGLFHKCIAWVSTVSEFVDVGFSILEGSHRRGGIEEWTFVLVGREAPVFGALRWCGARAVW